MSYSDFDMKMMAVGEIGAHFMALLLAVASWLYFDGLSFVLKVPIALVVLFVTWKASVAFVHIGYKPEDR